MDVARRRHDPLEDVAELARKADEIDHDRERRDDHCHIFHGVPVRQNCRPLLSGPNSLLLSSQDTTAAFSAASPRARSKRKSPGAGTPGLEPGRDQSDGPYAHNYAIYL
jgi:hypothetical protein